MDREEFARIVNNVSSNYAKYIEFCKAAEDIGFASSNTLFDYMIDAAIDALNMLFPDKPGVVACYIFKYYPDWIEDVNPAEAKRVMAISNAYELFDYLAE